MHKFIDNIVAFSLKNKFFVFFCTVIAIIAGVVSFRHTPIDAFPDVTNTKVTIITQWPGRSAEEVYYDSGGDSHEFGTEEDRYPFDNLVWVVSHQCAV